MVVVIVVVVEVTVLVVAGTAPASVCGWVTDIISDDPVSLFPEHAKRVQITIISIKTTVFFILAYRFLKKFASKLYHIFTLVSNLHVKHKAAVSAAQIFLY